MIKYLTIKKAAKKSEQPKKYTYGICACAINGKHIEIVNCIDNISNDIVWLRTLADKLNKYDVEPIHLYDIIEDELYSLRE